MKDTVRLIPKKIEKAEDELLARKANDRLAKMKDEDLIPWDDAARLARWNDASDDHSGC